ncbi:MAG: beta/gamma crystallin family protein, partial [Alphaproteobacteria bacterium]|nr:beta/gamma crystallin family protein [Alphaproteobacteria bacterium]
MRRLSLRTVIALTVPAFFTAPSALAQYAADYGRGGEDVPAAIALFSDENYYGDVRDVYDPFNKLSDLGFNDRPRSVAVFAGQWELCEHKDFTGRCVFIREDVSDLGWFGLAGRVSSARPVYEYTEAQHGLMFTRDKYGYIRYADNEI